MAEYICGHEFIREPDELLPEGTVVPTHTHEEQHNTHFTMGLWQAERFVPIVDADGKQLTHKKTITLPITYLGVTKDFTEEVDELMWQALPLLQIQGGGPRSILNIPAVMSHRFTLLKGWGFYKCVFGHRDADGKLTEAFQGFLSATR